MNGSPLGKYAAPAAAIASLSIIGVCLFALVFQVQLQISNEALHQLELLAALAAGALFGSSVAVNGYKAPLEATHRRTDVLEKRVDANTAAIVATGDTKATDVLTAASIAAATAALPVPSDP